MVSPFPGMNPYLEHPEIWPGVHLLLIAALAESLSPQLRPKYSVAVEVRMYEVMAEQSLLVGIPDVAVQKASGRLQPASAGVAIAETEAKPTTVMLPMPVEVRQGFLEIREVATKEVVTVVELLSPINKRSGQGRQKYEAKRQRILTSSTNLVEIDLLRSHQPMPMYGEGLECHYRILVSRGDRRPQAELYAFNLRDKVPSFRLPLRQMDLEPLVNLSQLLNDIYERSSYDLKLDYQQSPIPPFPDAESEWINNLLQESTLR